MRDLNNSPTVTTCDWDHVRFGFNRRRWETTHSVTPLVTLTYPARKREGVKGTFVGRGRVILYPSVEGVATKGSKPSPLRLEFETNFSLSFPLSNRHQTTTNRGRKRNFGVRPYDGLSYWSRWFPSRVRVTKVPSVESPVLVGDCDLLTSCVCLLCVFSLVLLYSLP